jgi:hypothetical protein
MRGWTTRLRATVALAALSGAADALAAPVVEILPIGDVPGDGQTLVNIVMVALDDDGAPLSELKLKLDADTGKVGPVSALQPGVYAAVWEPPVVTGTQQATLSARVKVGATSLTPSRTAFVQPPAREPVTLAANPGALVLGADASATLTLSAPDLLGQPAVPGDLEVRVSSGTVSELVPLGGGRLTARYTPPAQNYPHLALFTVSDLRRPGLAPAVLVVPLQGRVAYPVTGPAGATVVLRVGDRDYGPTVLDGSGNGTVAITVSPGETAATQITVSEGVPTETPLDLAVPAFRRLQLAPMVRSIPSSARQEAWIHAVVVTPTGAPDGTAALSLSATAGKVGTPEALGGGVFRAVYRPPDGRIETAATIQASLTGDDLQRDGLEILLTPPPAETLVLSASPATVPADGSAVTVRARALAQGGVPYTGADLFARVTGAPDARAVPAGDGEFTLSLSPSGAGDVVVDAEVVPARSRNAVQHVTVLPDAPVVDGASASLVVRATDGFGAPVAAVPVVLTVTQGSGVAPATVTTDAEGRGIVTLTGLEEGLTVLRATVGGRAGEGAVLRHAVAPEFSWPVRGSGTAAYVGVVEALRATTARLVVAGEGGVGASVAAVPAAPPLASPAPAPPPTAAPAGAAGAMATLTLLLTATEAPPGGEVGLRIAATDAAGLPVPGAMLTVLASGGARPAPVTELGDGLYSTTIAVPRDATGTITVSVLGPAGVVGLADLAVVGAPVKAAKAAKAPKATALPEIDRPFGRLRVSFVGSSYSYRQEPGDDTGALLNTTLGWGGDGTTASPLGAEVAARVLLPMAPYVGLHAQARFTRYSVASDAFNEPIRDTLYAVRTHLVGRGPIRIGRDELSFGARVGFRYDDLITFRGCSDPGCEIRYEPLGLPGLGVGGEVGFEAWKLYGLVAVEGGFANGTAPYALNVDVNLGFQIHKNFFVDAGFGWQRRRLTLEGADSGQVRGRLADDQFLGTVGAGVSF